MINRYNIKSWIFPIKSSICNRFEGNYSCFTIFQPFLAKSMVRITTDYIYKAHAFLRPIYASVKCYKKLWKLNTVQLWAVSMIVLGEQGMAMYGSCNFAVHENLEVWTGLCCFTYRKMHPFTPITHSGSFCWAIFRRKGDFLMRWMTWMSVSFVISHSFSLVGFEILRCPHCHSFTLDLVWVNFEWH